MQGNKEAQGALRSYLAMQSPGYAFLVDAPWGAGKTYFVRSVCQVDQQANAVRYVSLNGVSNEAVFRRALLRDSFEANLTTKGEFIVNIFSRRLHLGDLGSLARDIVEERLIAKLPDTLIFDDIERSSIEPQILLGLLNDFVEYSEKRVILVMHTDGHDHQEALSKRAEKLIGRKITLDADFNAAYPAFVSTIQEGLRKSYLKEHPPIVQLTFAQAGHHNLRILRHALRECALLLDRIDADLFTARESMTRFVKTYLESPIGDQ